VLATSTEEEETVERTEIGGEVYQANGGGKAC